MIYTVPKSTEKSVPLMQRFLAENAGVAASNFSGRRRPLPPQSAIAQPGTAEVLITWKQPTDNSGGDINGYNIYQGDENNCVLNISNPVTGQVRIKMKPGTPTNFYISSYNALKESIKVPVAGSATSDLFVVTGTSGGTGGTSPGPPPNYQYGCFSGNVAIKTPYGFVKFGNLPPTLQLVNGTGTHQAKLVVHPEQMWDMIDMGEGKLVTPEHPMRCDDGQYRPASEKFSTAPRVKFYGPVYNIEVQSEKEEDLHYLLENGHVAHNIRKA